MLGRRLVRVGVVRMVVEARCGPRLAHAAITCLVIAAGVLVWVNGEPVIAAVMLLTAGADVIWGLVKVAHRRAAERVVDPKGATLRS